MIYGTLVFPPMLHARFVMDGPAADQRQEAMRRVGVVIVHGMGHPQPAALVEAIVQSLARHLRELGARPLAGLIPAVESSIDAAGRRHFLVRYADREWEFTEAHWAPHITSPPFLDTLAWAVWHFLAHAFVLARQALFANVLPAVLCLLTVAASILAALLLVPVIIILLPVSVPLAALTHAITERAYRASFQKMPDDAPLEVLMRRLRQWRRATPWIIAGVYVIVLVAVLAGLSALTERSAPVMLAFAYFVAAFGIISYRLACQLAVDPCIGDTPVTIAVAIGLVPSKAGFLRARIGQGQRGWLLRETLPEVLSGLTLAPALAADKWLLLNREANLRTYLNWVAADSQPTQMIKASSVLVALIALRCLASLAWFFLYAIGALLILPLTAAMLAISATAHQRAPDSLLSRLKARLEALVLTSIGDINMFTRHPAQAEVARKEVEQALDSLSPRCADLYVVAHSLGCAVSYDTLVQPQNAERAARVRSLVTIGGILPMVWRTRPHRDSFDYSLPSGIRWLNLWARFDPAEGGPIDDPRLRIAMPGRVGTEASQNPRSFLWLAPLPSPEPATFEDVAVSNEDNIVLDHTSYWQNVDEVTPRIAREIWPDGPRDLDAFERSDAIRAFRRRVRILRRTGPRVLALYALPISLLAGVQVIVSVACTAALFALVWSLTRSRQDDLEVAPEDDSSLPPLREETVTFADGKTGTTIAFGSRKRR